MILPDPFFNHPNATRWHRGYRLAFVVLTLRQFHLAKAGATLRLHRQNWTLSTGYAWPVLLRRISEMVDDGLATWSIEETVNGTYGTLTLHAPLTPPVSPPEVIVTPDHRPRYPADDRYEARRREVRAGGNGHAEPAPQAKNGAQDFTPDYAGVVRQTTPADTESVQYCTVPESVLSKERLESVLEQDRTDSVPARSPVEPPISVIEEFVLLGMEREKADLRFQEFKAARCRDALDTLLYRQETKTLKKNALAFVIDFLTQKRTLPVAVEKIRQEKTRAQQAQAIAEPHRAPEPTAPPP